MLTLPCITAVANPAAGCRILGEHLSSCRGIRLDGNRAVECTGCLPQPATHGLLCASCHARFVAALDMAVDLITHMRSIERGPIPDGPSTSGSKPGSKVIVPMSWLTADDVWEVLRELAFRQDALELLEVQPRGTTAYGFGTRDTIEHVRDQVELAVALVAFADLADMRAATMAVAFYRAMQVALHRYPLDAATLALPFLRCTTERGGCGLFTLERRPPLQYLDPLVYRCVNPKCGKTHDPFIVQHDLAVMRPDLEASMAA